MPTQVPTTGSLNTKLLLKTLVAFKQGDFSTRLPGDWTGEAGKIADTLNDIIALSDKTTKELERVSRAVGKEGKITHRAAVPAAAGSWLRLVDLTNSVNSMASNLTSQVRNIAEVTTAVANGDLSKKITVDVKGEILELKNTINTMVDQLNSFASEVTRVAREVGTEGKLGGQAD